MKKIDKLILRSFLGPFILTFLVVVFILLTQYMLKYFDEFVGKDLGIEVFAQLLSYFAINMTPVAFPLAVLLSSLMTFGNLGEHFELTAIKSSGISLTRALLPIFVFTGLLTVLAFFSNNYVVPRANLKAFSLLYDIRQKKPSLDLKEGAFYNGIPGFSIKVNKKYPDGETLGDLIIYNHTNGLGNTDVIIADSGRMYSILNDRYLVLEMFNGNHYTLANSGGPSYSSREPDEFVRNNFFRTKKVFSLASFDLQRTDEQLFSTNRLMKNVKQLQRDVDSMRVDASDVMYSIYLNANQFFLYHKQDPIKIPEEFKPKYNVGPSSEVSSYSNPTREVQNASDSVNSRRRAEARQKSESRNKGDRKLINKFQVRKTGPSKDSTGQLSDSSLVKERKLSPEQYQDSIFARLDSIFSKPETKGRALSIAVGQARFIKNHLMVQTVKLNHLLREARVYDIEKHKKFTQAAACLVMFLIGAPLGAIIKKGGLGIPVIVSILFFIIYYVSSILGEKWGRENLIDPALGAWGSNLLLLPFGILFLKQARNDARLFEADFYKVIIDKIQQRFKLRKDKPEGTIEKEQEPIEAEEVK